MAKSSKPDSELVVQHLEVRHKAEVRCASGAPMPGTMGMSGAVSHYGQCSGCGWQGPVRLDAASANNDVETHLTDPAL